MLSIIGSDVKDWSEYEKCTFAELRLPVESFAQFCLLAKRDVVVVDTLRNKKQIYNLIASPYKNVKLSLKLYADVNVIFGQKGTGKSEILNSLYNRMVDQGISCVKYTGAEKDDDFTELLKTKDMDRDLSKVGASDCEDAFSAIFDWVDSSPTLFTNYSSWYETRDNNANKRSMRITEAAFLGDAELPELDGHINDHMVTIENVEDEQFITVHHPMTKEHYISFVAYVTSDRLQMVKLYPEGNAQTRLQLRGMGHLYYYCNRHGLFKKKI